MPSNFLLDIFSKMQGFTFFATTYRFSKIFQNFYKVSKKSQKATNLRIRCNGMQFSKDGNMHACVIWTTLPSSNLHRWFYLNVPSKFLLDVSSKMPGFTFFAKTYRFSRIFQIATNFQNKVRKRKSCEFAARVRNFQKMEIRTHA